MSIWQGSNMIAGSGGGGIANYDGKSITENSMEEIQTVGVINSRDTSTAVKTWTGTKAQYDAIVTKDPNTLYNITDDTDITDIRALGQIVQSTIPLVDAGLHLLDGSVIAYGSYKAFVDYIAGLVTDYPDLFTTEANWQTSVTNYGACGKFVYDSVNKTVRLPKITGFTEGTTDVIALGDLVEAGLPNIEGHIRTTQAFNLNDVLAGTDGAFSFTQTDGGPGGSGSDTKGTFAFSAQDSNPIYGNSDTVQPQSIKVLYYICIATYPKTQIEVDIDEIATDLNGKVDKANLTECQVVVEAWHEGTEWYRVWSDGWCEQGGAGLFTSSGTVITLLKPYSDTNYSILATADRSSSGSCADGVGLMILSKNTTSFKLSNKNYGSSLTVNGFWEAKGYIA